jgi:hypothetical protein
MVTICICLHNVYVIHRDKLDDEWTNVGDENIHRDHSNQLGQLENVDIYMIATQAAKEMRKHLKIDKIEVETM